MGSRNPEFIKLGFLAEDGDHKIIAKLNLKILDRGKERWRQVLSDVPSYIR